MGFFDSIKESITNHFNKKREERERMERLQEDAANQQAFFFEQQFAENAKIVALAKAKSDAMKLSGLEKLRATNTALQMQSAGAERPGRWAKLREFTRRNKQRMQENLAKTAEKRKVAKEIREERFTKKSQQINDRMARARTRTTGFR